MVYWMALPDKGGVAIKLAIKGNEAVSTECRMYDTPVLMVKFLGGLYQLRQSEAPSQVSRDDTLHAMRPMCKSERTISK